MTEITGSGQSTVKSYKYDAFGNILQETGPTVPGGFTYTGRQYHSRSGLYYYRARWYSPTLGRFLSQDPIGHLGGVNLYAYVGNDAVNSLDPLGLEPLPEFTRRELTPYFPDINLDTIDIHPDGIPWYVPGDALGYTGKNGNIYFKQGWYNPYSSSGIALIGHELLHVRQRQNNVPILFELMYLGEYPANWINPFDDYNRFEDPAYKLEDAILKALQEKYSCLGSQSSQE